MGNPSKLKPRLGLVSTVAHTGQRLETSIRYHLHLGFSRIYLFFDDPEDPGIEVARRFPDVVVTPNDARLHALQKDHFLFEKLGKRLNWIESRQHLNAETGIHFANDDKLDWILHLDDDELIYTSSMLVDFFKKLPAKVEQVIFWNHEAATENFIVQNCFEEVSLFKNHPRVITPDGTNFSPKKLKACFTRQYYYLGYEHGKAAARVKPDLISDGAHRFRFHSRPCNTMESRLEPVIYHYNSCGFAEHLEKYQSYYQSARNVPSPNDTRPPFTQRSREIIENGDLSGFERFYREQALYDDPDEVSRLIENGIFHRNLEIAKVIRGL